MGKGTLVYLPITHNKDFTKDPSKWDARIRNVDGSRITLQVRIPASAGVGVWRLRISTKPQGSRDIKTFEVNNKIYVLFNAWNKGTARGLFANILIARFWFAQMTPFIWATK